MSEDRRRSEKDEKDEKNHNEKDRGEGMEEKWQRDPLSGIFFGLIVVLVGVFLALASMNIISWAIWWAYLLAGVGVVLIVEAIIRYASPTQRRPVFVRLLVGLILIAIGGSNIAGLENWWPLLIIIVGAAIVLYGITRAMRPRE
ncbi:MAG: hypothetical protein SVO26_07885 [Chloroflexota bacterium]|nr:hypothetical protein [Chloroflexota bacterium]